MTSSLNEIIASLSEARLRSQSYSRELQEKIAAIEVQDAAVEAFGRLVSEAPPELRGYCEYCGKFAQQHRDIIAKFGRFPHRNAVLGRESTAAEIEWLAAEGARFGQ